MLSRKKDDLILPNQSKYKAMDQKIYHVNKQTDS